jgi:histidine triad (HIT) family protein
MARAEEHEEHCLFCRIVAGAVHAEVVHRDERAVAFRDINPQAPTHILIVPVKHVASLAEAEAADEQLLGHLLLLGAELARREGIVQRGFRTVINTNREAGQSVFHVHLHILGGRYLGWPPG